MIRKRIYLIEDIERIIDVIAEQEQKNSSQVIRELIEDGIKRKHQPATLGAALLGLAELGKKHTIEAPSDLSDNLDHYLYGDND
jgi:hypothetical protein